MVPIDRELLTSSVISEGQMSLPAEAYTDDDVLAWEMEHFFDESWVCVGRSEDLRGPGDRCAVAIGRESALLVRDEGGNLRALARRGGRVVEWQVHPLPVSRLGLRAGREFAGGSWLRE